MYSKTGDLKSVPTSQVHLNVKVQFGEQKMQFRHSDRCIFKKYFQEFLISLIFPPIFKIVPIFYIYYEECKVTCFYGSILHVIKKFLITLCTVAKGPLHYCSLTIYYYIIMFVKRNVKILLVRSCK